MLFEQPKELFIDIIHDLVERIQNNKLITTLIMSSLSHRIF